MNNQGSASVLLGRCKLLSINGNHVMCKAVSEDKLGAYSLFELTVPPQAGPPTQIHYWEEEAYYILEGELLIQEGDRTYTVTAGSFVDFPKNTSHTFKNVGTVPVRLLAIITPAWYGKFFEEWASQQQQNSPRHLQLLHKP